MTLKNLKTSNENISDSMILNALLKSEDKDIINYVINLSSDLLKTACVIDEYKINTKNNLNNFDKKELGEISTYICLIPYVQIILSKHPDYQRLANSFLETFIGYIIGTSSKSDFLGKLTEIRVLLNISNLFMDELIEYFSSKNEFIKTNILSKMNL